MKKLQLDEKPCQSCGQTIKAKAAICPKCGVPQKSIKSKITAAWLALLLGGFGIHRFYLREIGLGLIYLLFSWTFIPLMLSLLDFIAFLRMKEHRFNQLFNN